MRDWDSPRLPDDAPDEVRALYNWLVETQAEDLAKDVKRWHRWVIFNWCWMVVLMGLLVWNTAIAIVVGDDRFGWLVVALLLVALGLHLFILNRSMRILHNRERGSRDN